MTVPGHVEPVRDGTLEIGNGPKLAAGCGGFGTEELPRRVLMEVATEHLPLFGGEFGAIATDSSIDQTSQTRVPIDPAPVQQTGATAARNVDDLRHRVARPIESHRLIATARGTILGLQVGLLERRCLRRGQDEMSLCHA